MVLVKPIEDPQKGRKNTGRIFFSLKANHFPGSTPRQTEGQVVRPKAILKDYFVGLCGAYWGGSCAGDYHLQSPTPSAHYLLVRLPAHQSSASVQSPIGISQPSFQPRPTPVTPSISAPAAQFFTWLGTGLQSDACPSSCTVHVLDTVSPQAWGSKMI
jgi:hypothetical protein